MQKCFWNNYKNNSNGFNNIRKNNSFHNINTFQVYIKKIVKVDCYKNINTAKSILKETCISF